MRVPGTHNSDITAVQELVSVKVFLAGAAEHIDGLAGYVRDFLAEHGGELNDRLRPWTAESCADALKIPAATLRRWLEQGESAPVLPIAKAEQVKVSHAKSALRDPVQRRAVVEGLSTGQRDELRADLISIDTPGSTECRHCAIHCPSSTLAKDAKSDTRKPKLRLPKPKTEEQLKIEDERDWERTVAKLKARMAARQKKNDLAQAAAAYDSTKDVIDYVQGADGVWHPSTTEATDTPDLPDGWLGVVAVAEFPEERQR
jgi:hypothetical protein